MRRMLFATAVLMIASAFAQSAPASHNGDARLIGTWEGDSVCQVPKPCTTEHVVYEIKRGEAGKFAIAADKVVNGEREWMGTLECEWSESAGRLTCPMGGRRPGVWVFDLKDDELIGTATTKDDNRLFRKINVKRKR